MANYGNGTKASSVRKSCRLRQKKRTGWRRPKIYPYPFPHALAACLVCRASPRQKFGSKWLPVKIWIWKRCKAKWGDWIKPRSDNALLVQVFFPCCQTAPDVPFRFVYIQYLPCLWCKGRVDLGKAFCYIFMYGCYYLEWSGHLPYLTYFHSYWANPQLHLAYSQSYLMYSQSIRFHPIPDLQTGVRKYPRSPLCPLRFSG